MGKKYLVMITDSALEDLLEIAGYIAHELKVPQTALRYLDLLEESIASLETFPQRYAFTTEEPFHSRGIRLFSAKNFLIYFSIDEVNSIVRVTMICYAKRDQRKMLTQMQE